MSIFRGLGVDVREGNNDPSKIIELHKGLDFTPRKVPSFYATSEGDHIYTGEHRIINDKTGKVIDGGYPVSTKYKPHDVKAILQSLCEVADMAEMIISNIAVLRWGAHILVKAESKETFAPVLGDIYGGNLLFKISNVPGITTACSAYVLRLICLNGATAREGVGDGILTLTHLHEYNAVSREKVERMMGALSSSLTSYKGRMEMLYSTPVEHDEAQVFKRRVLEIGEEEESRTLTSLGEAMVNQPGLALTMPTKGDVTFATLYNGVTYWVDHVRGRKPETALFSSIYGEGERLKRRALKVALEMIVEGRN